jgi:dipeptidyl aminopeptidase/acylaminoacyl peptidase
MPNCVRVLALLSLLGLSATLFAVADVKSDGAKSDVAATVERFARVGSASSPDFSPDGKWVSFIANLSGVPQVWIVSASGGYPRMVTNSSDPVTQAHWSPASDWLAVTVAPGGGLNTQVYLVKPDGTGMRRLTDGGKDNNAIDAWTDDGTQLYIDSSRRDPASRDVFAVDVTSGELRLVAKNPGIGGVSNLSRDGSRALLSRLRSRGSNDLYSLDTKTGKDQILTEHAGPGDFFGALSPDGKTVYMGTNKDRDLVAFARMTLRDDGTPGPVQILAERKDAELDDITLNREGTMLALSWNVGGRTEMSLYDIKTGKPTPLQLPGEIVFGAQFSNDGRQLAIATSGAAQPADVWIADVASLKFRQLTFSPHAGIDLNALVRPQLVTFPAHDGLQLSGWLYRPQQQTGAYVISFHGGPEGQERPAFRSDYQALLSQGIGVLAPNVRGSSGFGKRFVNLDNGELRVNAVRDIKSCVDYLVDNHIADAHRIGITGGSYGGYMTMAGITEYPDLFAAGVDLFGIVNFVTFFQHTEPWMAAISTIEYGDPATQKDMLDKLSPIYKLDRIKAATMVQHGANDTNVPVIEAEQIVNTLKARGVPVEYILFPDEGHGFRKIPNRIRSTTEMVRFFREHLLASSQPVTTAGR